MAARQSWLLTRICARHVRTTRLLALLVAAGLLVLAGCDQTTSVGKARATGEAKSGSERTLTGQELAQKGGLCEENRRVSDPEPDSPEWAIWRLYQLAQAEDNATNFQEFVKLFPSSRNVRELKEMYWGRIRSSVHKMVVEPGKPDYVICRSIATSDGRKYYLQTSDPRQTPPPVTVGEVEGKQRILFLTPF